MKYRKKPIVIEAIHYTGSRESFDNIWEWMGGSVGPNCGYEGTLEDPQTFKIITLEGKIIASPDDWIIKGIAGEFYPCKSDIFEVTYEQV